ncbi:hypothetical protein [Nocardioides nematodiphilus]|uniref:hypothetical protein n=1 Tax=Nocardioides nematodiphilus TaxID=2849669 RepID=UPI001CD978FF|nr:hypothetical protein [Nocardioides nematodiphilus]MCA1982171.1 hypothetical protein [Nocardioides nematodiphilus]
MRLITIALALATSLALGAGTKPADADEQHADVSAGTDSFQVGLSENHAENAGDSTKTVLAVSATPGDAHDITMNVCDLNGESACGAQYACSDGSVMTVTYTYSDTGVVSNTRYSCPARRGPTTADVERAFRSIPMHPAPVHIQPPGGETLVNFDSIFFTDPFSLNVTKRPLGVPVAFHITVEKYIWHFGDGSSLTTTDAGAAYPDQTLVHRYLKKGPVSVTLETVYQAGYSIDGGPQQHLADTVTRTSPAQQLTVLTATPHLVAD